MFEKRGFIFGVLVLFSLGIICGAAVENSLHLTIQTTNATGITTGTFAFVFNISDASDCSNVVYSDSATLTTDSRGIISHYLENVVLDFSTQYWLCYYRNGTLINATKLAKTPYSFSASNISTTGGLNIAGNLNITGNLTVGGEFTEQNVSRVRVMRGTAQTIPHNNVTIVQYNNESFDNLNEYDNTTNYRFTATQAGYYLVDASLLFDSYAWTAAKEMDLFLYKNGVLYSALDIYTSEVALTLYLGLVGSDIIYLNVGDYIDVRVVHTRGSDTNLHANTVYNFLSISQIKQEVNIGSSSSSSSGVPAGMIAPFNLTSCPTGWTLADGNSGTPDLRGIFIRGSGTNSILKYANGSYFSSILGTYGNDSFQGFGLSDSITGQLQGYSIGQPSDNDASGFKTVALFGGTSTLIIPNANDGTHGTPRIGYETSPAYYSTIYCVKTTEDSATSNSIWATSGNNVLLNNASKKLNLSSGIVSNLTLESNTPNLKFQIPFVEGSSTAGKITFTNQDYNGAYYPSGMAGIRSELYSQENDNGALIFSAMSIGTLYDVMTINGQGATIHQSLTVTGQGSTINQSAWIAPTFQNSWVNYGESWNVAGYMKDSMGFVHLRGLVKSGTIGQCIFTLPAGYRPQYEELQIVQTSPDTFGRLDITTAGCVQPTLGSNTWFSLDGITFRAYA
jgi:hypothetical protein